MIYLYDGILYSYLKFYNRNLMVLENIICSVILLDMYKVYREIFMVFCFLMIVLIMGDF